MICNFPYGEEAVYYGVHVAGARLEYLFDLFGFLNTPYVQLLCFGVWG